MTKIDLKKELKKYFSAPSKEAVKIDVPEFNYFMVDGFGDPNNSPVFQEAVELLYGLSYTLKFIVKKENPDSDYSVMPLQGLWWADNMEHFLEGKKENWKWTLMILQPDFITTEQVNKARIEAEKKKKVSFEKVRFQKYNEGLAAQIMHIGPYSEEHPTIEKLHKFIADSGCKRFGLHHEIYLGDPRRADPAKLKTIIRQPMR